MPFISLGCIMRNQAVMTVARMAMVLIALYYLFGNRHAVGEKNLWLLTLILPLATRPAPRSIGWSLLLALPMLLWSLLMMGFHPGAKFDPVSLYRGAFSPRSS